MPEGDVVDTVLRQLNQLTLSYAQQEFLQVQWLHRYQVIESRTRIWKRVYHSLRLFVVLGSVLLPFLVSLTFPQTSWQNFYAWGVVGLSLAIALAAIIDQVLGTGDRYRHNYELAERLNSEWWRYQQLTGPFRSSYSHADAYDLFLQRLQQISPAVTSQLPSSHSPGETPHAR